VNIILFIIRDIFSLIFNTSMICLSIYYYKKFSSISIHRSYYFISTRSVRFSFKKVKPSHSNGRRLLLMSINLSILSIISHLIVSLVFFISDKDVILFQVICLILAISILIKNILNVFVFYYFKSELKRNFLPLDLFRNHS
jgi:hypothetical protein